MLVFLQRKRVKKDDVTRVQLDKHSPTSLILISKERADHAGQVG